MFMYLDEVPEGQTRDDLAMIIRRSPCAAYAKGVKNEKGIWITPAFPKLIYVLDEDNIDRGFQVLVSDRTGSQMYGKTYGAGLYFCQGNA